MPNPQTTPPGEILPCPFCGEAPFVEPLNPEVEGDAWTRISCNNSDCPAVCEVRINADDTHRAEAIEAWNSRSAAPRPPAEAEIVEKLREGKVIAEQRDAAYESWRGRGRVRNVIPGSTIDYALRDAFNAGWHRHAAQALSDTSTNTGDQGREG